VTDWSVTDLGEGTYLFHWRPGFYVSPFLVTREGVLAIDPIAPTAARAYRAAIATITNAPVTLVIYSHEHRDHSSGAAELATNATIIAQRRAAERFARRPDPTILPPTLLVENHASLQLGGKQVEAYYFGPNHSPSNLALLLSTAEGPLLYYCDVVEPGFAPYRNLPDTDVAGLLESLAAVSALSFRRCAGGHGVPGPAEWVSLTHQYLLDLLAATEREYRAQGEQVPLPGEDGVAMTERVRWGVCQRAAEALRSQYGHWKGFEVWAPLTADRLLSYLITGN
jgi:glyoxylase-like metal-dependent hydrolase (beta-lactamase superfamily II)